MGNSSQRLCLLARVRTLRQLLASILQVILDLNLRCIAHGCLPVEFCACVWPALLTALCVPPADFKNVSIVAHYIKERTKNAQFVIISLRNNMFELADRLVGIYKTDNATKSVTINPAAFVVQPAAVVAN